MFIDGFRFEDGLWASLWMWPGARMCDQCGCAGLLALRGGMPLLEVVASLMVMIDVWVMLWSALACTGSWLWCGHWW